MSDYLNPDEVFAAPASSGYLDPNEIFGAPSSAGGGRGVVNPTREGIIAAQLKRSPAPVEATQDFLGDGSATDITPAVQRENLSASASDLKDIAVRNEVARLKPINPQATPQELQALAEATYSPNAAAAPSPTTVASLTAQSNPAQYGSSAEQAATEKARLDFAKKFNASQQKKSATVQADGTLAKVGTDANTGDQNTQAYVNDARKQSFISDWDAAHPVGAQIADIGTGVVGSLSNTGRDMQNLGLATIGGLQLEHKDSTDDNITQMIADNHAANAREAQATTNAGRFAGAVTDMLPGIAATAVNPLLGGAVFATQFGGKAGMDAVDQGKGLANANMKMAVGALSGMVGGELLTSGSMSLVGKLPFLRSVFTPGAVDSIATVANRTAQTALTAGAFSGATRVGDAAADALTGQNMKDENASYNHGFDPVTELAPILFLGMAHGIPEYASRNKMGGNSVFHLGEGADTTINVRHDNGQLFSSPAAATEFATKNADQFGGETPKVKPITRKMVEPDAANDDVMGYVLDATEIVQGKAHDAAELANRAAALAKAGGKYDFNENDKANIESQSQQDIDALNRKQVGAPDQTVTDFEGTDHTIPGRAAEALTPDEASHLAFLKDGLDPTTPGADGAIGVDHQSLARKLGYTPEQRSILTPGADPSDINHQNTVEGMAQAAEASLPNIDVNALAANHANATTTSVRASLGNEHGTTVDSGSVAAGSEGERSNNAAGDGAPGRASGNVTKGPVGSDTTGTADSRGKDQAPALHTPDALIANLNHSIEGENKANGTNVGKVKLYSGKETAHVTRLRDIAKTTGLSVVFIDHADQGNKSTNGVFHDGTLYVNPNAPRALLNIFGHELGHKIKVDSPELHAKIVEAFKGLISDKQISKTIAKYNSPEAIKAAQEAAKAGDNTSMAAMHDHAMEEAVSDVIGNRVGDKSFWSFLAMKDKPLFAKLAQKFKDLFAQRKSQFDMQWKGETMDHELAKAHSVLDEVIKKYMGDKAAERMNESSANRDHMQESMEPGKPKFSKEDYDLDFTHGMEVSKGSFDDFLEHLTPAQFNAKIEAEMMQHADIQKREGVSVQHPDTVDFGSTLDKHIKAHGITPEHAYPDMQYKTRDSAYGMRHTAQFKVGGKEYKADATDGRTPNVDMSNVLKNTIGENHGYGTGTDMEGLSSEAKKGWNKRFAVSADLYRRKFDLLHGVTAKARDNVLSAWKSIAAKPEAFEFKSADGATGRTVQAVAQQIADQMLDGSRYSAKLVDEPSIHGNQSLHIELTDTKTGTTGEALIEFSVRDKKMVMHTADLEKGSGMGKPIYQIGQALASKFGAKINSDFMLLGVNSYRRTEQMMSGALRSGKSETMQPGIGQRVYGWKEKAKTQDQHDDNTVRIALANARNALEFVPEIKDFGYDLATDKFFMKGRPDSPEGRLVAGAKIREILGRNDVRTASISRSTLARAAVTLEAADGTLKVPDKIAKPLLYSLEDKSSQSSYDKENQQHSVIVGGKPGEFDWNFHGDAKAPPFASPTQGIDPRLSKIGPAVHSMLKSKGVSDIADSLGIKNLQVTPTRGSWKGQEEPSYVLTGEGMTFENANTLSKLLGIGMAQDATIVTQPVHPGDEDTWPALYIGNGKRLSVSEVNATIAAAKKAGLDYTTSTDGQAFKFFFDGSDYESFVSKVSDIASQAKLKNVDAFGTRSQFNDSKDYTQSGDQQGQRQVWDQPTSSGSSDLFGRTVDHILIPYAKAVGAEGYRFSPERFAERFGLSDAQRSRVVDALRPKNGRNRSTADIVTGEETLPVTSSGKRGQATNVDVMTALQNRAAKDGLIDPSDRSPEARKVMSQSIADEIIQHISRPEGKSAIGWYDAALKKAKDIYHSIFPEIKADKDKELLFDAMLGIASQGNDVHSNSLFSARMMDLLQNGKTLPEAVDTLKGTFGEQTRAIENNYMKLHDLIERNGFDKMRSSFNKTQTVGEWNAELRKDKDLWFNGKPLSVDGAAEQNVTGWMVFGPKIGSFINNLHGDYSTLTADLWFSRSWNRLLGHMFHHTPEIEGPKYQAFREALIAENAGTKSRIVAGKEKAYDHGTDVASHTPEQMDALLSDPNAMLSTAESLEEKFRKGGYKEKSALRRAAKSWIEFRQDSVEAPRTDTERAFQQKTMEDAQKIVKRKTGQDISIADMQAALWYHEKELYAKLGVGSKKTAPADYADAAAKTKELYDQGKLFQNGDGSDVRFSMEDEKRPYGAAPDALMGFRKYGPQAAFGEQAYKHVQFVKVDFGDHSMVDAVTGLNGPHAMERARRNWKDAESIAPISREEAERQDPGIGLAVDHSKSMFSLEKPETPMEYVRALHTEAIRSLAPMSEAPSESRAIIKQFANDRRVTAYHLNRFDEYLKNNFSDEQLTKMWNAADEENDLLRTASTPRQMRGKGLDSLDAKERAAVTTLHEYGEALLQRAKDAGMFTGEGVPYWTPRMMVMLDDQGEYTTKAEGKGSGEDGLKFGTSSSNLKRRKYLTADETEAAMNAKGGEMVRNIRTMPMAMAKLENAIAGRELVDQIKTMGKSLGQEWLRTSPAEGFVVAKNPAFTTYKPLFEKEPDGTPARDGNGNLRPMLNMYGDMQMEKHPMYVRRDIDAALRAVLSSKDGAAYTGYMLLKSKAMSAIMISPMIHNMVIMAKAAALHPLTFPKLYWDGFFARKDPSLVSLAIKNGTVLVAQHGSSMDITDIVNPMGKQGGYGDVNESVINLGLRDALRAAGMVKTGDAVKKGLDATGDFVHGTLLWNRIADLQMGIFKTSHDKLVKEGYTSTAAAIIASHLANRYGGALPKENMSEIARKTANVLLFSRSFTLGNLGIMKDMLTGLPAGEKALLQREMGMDGAKQGISKARRTAIAGYIADVGMMFIVGSLAQDALDRNNKDRTWRDIAGDYGDRAKEIVEKIKADPTDIGSYDPRHFFSQYGNEPGKENRARLGMSDNNRMIYLRVPTGKVAEELLGWTSHPAELISNKLSPMVKSMWQSAVNDKGFGHAVYNEDDHFFGPKGLAIIKHIAGAQMNADTAQTAYDVATGHGSDIDKLKLKATMTGFSPSQGYPGGPEAAVMNKAETDFKNRVGLAKESAYRALKYAAMEEANGNKEKSSEYSDQAESIMEKAGMTPKEINKFVASYESPRDGPSKMAKANYRKHATAEDEARMSALR